MFNNKVNFTKKKIKKGLSLLLASSLMLGGMQVNPVHAMSVDISKDTLSGNNETIKYYIEQGVLPSDLVTSGKYEIVSAYGTYNNVSWNYDIIYSTANTNKMYAVNLNAVNINSSISCIDIPSEVVYNGVPAKVVGLGKSCFSSINYNSSITKITVPDTILYVSDSAFAGCRYITDIDFKALENIKVFGEYAFQNCAELKVDFLDKIIKNNLLNSYMFYGCNQITDVVIPSNIETIPTFCFYSSSITSLTVEGKDGKLVIEDKAFQDCAKLESFDIEREVVLGEASFRECVALKSLTFNKPITAGNYCFYGCTAIEDLVFNSVTNLGDYAFSNNASLATVKFNRGGTLGEYCFSCSFSMYGNENGQGTVEFNGGDIKIKKRAFLDCSNLKNAVFDESLYYVYVYERAFEDSGLRAIDVKGMYVKLDNGAFVCTPLVSSIKIGGSNVSLYGRPFGTENPPFSFSNNSIVKEVIFDCYNVTYFINPLDMSYTITGNTLYGLESLEKVVCSEKVRDFAIRVSEKDNDVDFYFKSPNTNCQVGLTCSYTASEVATDKSKAVSPTFYGCDNIKTYVEKSKSSVGNVYNLVYKPVISKISCSLKEGGEQVVLGNEIDTDKIDMLVTYADNTTYRPKVATDGAVGFTTDGKAETLGTTSYSIFYGGIEKQVTVYVVPKLISGFVAEYIGGTKIEGESATVDDFKITKVIFNDGTEQTDDIDTVFDKDCFSVSNNTLVDGYTDVELTYTNKNTTSLTSNLAKVTTMSAVSASAKKISSFDISLRDASKVFFSGQTVSKDDLYVRAVYNNKDVVNDFKDYKLTPVTGASATQGVVIVSADNYSQTFTFPYADKKVVGLEVDYNNTPVEAGKEVDKNNLVVKAVYNNGDNRVLLADEYDFLTYTIDAGKTNPVFVTYKADSSITPIMFTVVGIKSSTSTPSTDPSNTPSSVPSTDPSTNPSDVPSLVPSGSPSSSPSTNPSTNPSGSPSTNPSGSPSTDPSTNPSTNPSGSPSTNPSDTPSSVPSGIPSARPSGSPSSGTDLPVTSPAVSLTPSSSPSQGDTSVTPSSVALKLNKTKLTLGVNEKFTLKATSGEIAKIVSANSKVVKVLSSGKITAKKIGKIKLSVYDSSGNIKKVTITVKKAPTKIKASKSKLSLKVGKKYTLKPKFLSKQYSNKITFKSSNKKVASVSSGGIVVAKKKGKCSIILKTYNNKKCIVKVTVK